MQGGEIGGICLLAFLLSVGQGEELGLSKQLDESNGSTKVTELPRDDLPRPADDENLKITNSTVGVKETNISAEAPKWNLDSLEGSKKQIEEERTLPRDTQKLYLAPQNVLVSSSNTENNFTKEGTRTAKNDSPYYAGLSPTLYAAHLPSSSNKLTQEIKSKPRPASRISKAAFEESRRDFKSDEIQSRNADESSNSENTNAYPFSPSSSESRELRSGGPSNPYNEITGTSSAQAYAGAFSNNLIENNQGVNPYSFGYPPGPAANSVNMASANAFAQVLSSGTASAQSSAIVMEDAKSRVIWPNEFIFPSKIPGGENVIQCTKENEMYHYWSRSFDCLVCVCLNVFGLLEPVCAKCSGCRNPAASEPPALIPEQSSPTPDPFIPLLGDSYVPMPIPNSEPHAPSAPAPSLILEPLGQELYPTTPPPIGEVPSSCSPLPIGQSFANPLQPCQLCTCEEIVIRPGIIDVRIECKDSHNCIVPPDVTTLPPLPDVQGSVPLPACEKFPPHVPFPHPTESCMMCHCSLELSTSGLPEQQVTCYHDTGCDRIKSTTEPVITPPAPPIPIPVEPYAGSMAEAGIEPIPENYPVPVQHPNAVTSEEPIPWPPISTPAPPSVPLLPKKGPLPGPPPHDSCRPYPPDQPFQHPWDDCQVCLCSISKAVGVVNVEITCYTKLSCCIESPEHAITAIAENGVIEDTQVLPNVMYTQRPNIYKIGDSLGGNAEYNAVVHNTDDYNTQGLQNLGYASANALAQTSPNSLTQAIAQSNAVVHNIDEYTSQGLKNPKQVVANAIVQNSEDLQNQEIAQAKGIAYHTDDYYSQGLPNQGYSAVNAIAQNLSPYNSDPVLMEGLAEASAVAQSDVNDLSNQLPGPYQSLTGKGNIIAGAQSLAEANIAYGSKGSKEPMTTGTSQNQVYATANGLSQNSISNPLYSGSYQTPNTFSTIQTSADANAEYINLPLINSYNTGVPPNQAYGKENVGLAMKPGGSVYQSPTYQSAKAESSVTYDDTVDEYVPLPIPFKTSMKPQYNPRHPENLAYIGTITTNDKPLTTTYKPPQQYDSYNADVSKNKVYAEAVAQYNNRVPNTLNPVFGKYPDFSQNQGFAQANAQYNGILTSTYKPSALYNPYNSELSQNQIYAQANAQYSDLITTTLRPSVLYGQYNPGVSQSQVHGTPNAVYKGIPDKPPSLYNPYNSGSQNPIFSGANALAQNSLTNQDFYGSGQYQSANALGSVNGGDGSSATAEAISQSQDYSPYFRPGPRNGANSISSPPLGFPYQSNYYYPNSKYSSYIGKPNTGLNGQFKTSPVQYAGNYDFNGQADAIGILNPQSSYNPYTGYSQSLPSSNLYSSSYPNNYNYEINPIYLPGPYANQNLQSTAEAYAGTKSQIKSGEGYKEDSDESQ